MKKALSPPFALTCTCTLQFLCCLHIPHLSLSKDGDVLLVQHLHFFILWLSLSKQSGKSDLHQENLWHPADFVPYSELGRSSDFGISYHFIGDVLHHCDQSQFWRVVLFPTVFRQCNNSHDKSTLQFHGFHDTVSKNLKILFAWNYVIRQFWNMNSLCSYSGFYFQFLEFPLRLWCINTKHKTNCSRKPKFFLSYSKKFFFILPSVR